MQTKIGDKYIYDNFRIGVADHPADEDAIYLAFTDIDNERTHMFLMVKSQLPQFEEMIRSSRGAGIVIAGANEMPHA
jgi:hypothetical protein